MPAIKEQHPVFVKYKIEYLSRRLGLSEVYLIQMRDGMRAVRPGFRRRVARVMSQPEETLFLPVNGGEAQTQREGQP